MGTEERKDCGADDPRQEDNRITISALEQTLQSLENVFLDSSDAQGSTRSVLLRYVGESGKMTGSEQLPLAISGRPLVQPFYFLCLTKGNFDAARDVSIRINEPVIPAPAAARWHLYNALPAPPEWRANAARDCLGELLTQFGNAFLAIDGLERGAGLSSMLKYAGSISRSLSETFAQTLYLVLLSRLDVKRSIALQRRSAIAIRISEKSLEFPRQVLAKIAAGERDYLMACHFFDEWRPAAEETGYQLRLRNLAHSLYDFAGHHFSLVEWGELVERNRALAPKGQHGELTRRMTPDLSKISGIGQLPQP